MSRIFPQALIAIILGIFLSANASATTYYVAANGSDSNNGTSKSSPWLHAPGMPSCTGTCASTTPQAGDSFIFRGGDTWHFHSGSPSTGGSWVWKWSGSMSNCQLNPSAGTVVKSSCIYIGVDNSYFSGAGFKRPLFTQDNPITTSRPSSCSFDSTSFNAIDLGSHNYLIFDNFEMSGACWQGASSDGWVTISGDQVEVSNLYIHGWMLGTGGGVDDTYVGLGGGMQKTNYVLCDHNVFDNSDGSLGTTTGKASGFSIRNTCKEIAYSFFNKVSNGCICNPSSVHDNTFQFMYEPVTTQHGNIVEWNTGVAATGTLYIYNNVQHDTNQGVGFWPEPVQNDLYFFNNVFWNISNAGNCLMIDGQGSSGTPVTVFIFNNTFDNPCSVNFFAQHGGTEFNGTGIFQNNHIIGYPSASLNSLYVRNGSPTLTVVDNGNEVYQSESAANGQGYTAGNKYAPTSNNGNTVGAGGSLGNYCSTTSVSGLCSGTGDGASEGAGGVDIFPTIPITQRTGTWDVGAYQFGGVVPPIPPTGLTAIIQ